MIDDGRKIGIVPLGERIRLAGTAEFAGFDLEVTEARIDNLTRLLGRVYPQLSLEGVTLNGWTGLRPMTPDGTPVIGPTRYPNLFLNTGHGTLGWTMACGSGRAVADLVAGETPEIDFDGLTAARYGR